MTDDAMRARFASWIAWAGDDTTWPVSAVGASTVKWAVEVHRSQYGDAILAPASGRTAPHPFLWPGCWPLTGDRPIAELLSRACALALLSAPARAALAPRPGRDSHEAVLSELAVLGIAGLAHRAGWTVRVEPELPSGRRPDLQLTSEEGGEWWIEVTTVSQDRPRRDNEAWFHRLADEIHAIERSHNVTISGQADSIAIEGDELVAFMADLDAVAADVAAGGHSRAKTGPGIALEVRPGLGPGDGLDGPPLSGDMWTRLERRLLDKAAQTAGGTAWIHIDDRSNLFELTDLALVAEDEQLRRVSHNVAVVLADYPHINGVALTTGVTAATAQADWDTPLKMGAGGARGPCVMHRRLPGRRARRTFVIPLGAPTHPDGLRDWLDAEGSWLNWALAELGKPTFEAIVLSR